MSTRRLVLLARAGPARDRVLAGLVDAGAEPAAVHEPGTVEPARLEAEAVQAGALLVLLEPAVESALEQYEAVFGNRAIDLVFDEAEVALRREGWDTARWARHLAAKLHGYEDALPRGDGPATPARAGEPSEDVAAHDRPALHGDSPAQQATFYRDMEAVERRASALSLEGDDSAPAPAAADGAAGAVLVIAGLGGPDAIRQLLAALPGDFARPIIVRQHLDGGAHDKLVRQLQRATALPVALALAGEPVLPGHVHVLGDGLGLASSQGALAFARGGGDAALAAALHAPDSAVILLSGADPGVVDAAMHLAGNGGLAAGQSPEGCFDPKAAQLLAARGGRAGSALELAQMLGDYWRH